VQIAVEGSAPQVNADPELLKIVFENLLVNSAQAMDGTGTIRVSIGSVGGHVQVVFADSGPGISDAVRDKIFAPFFTTKSRGSGLGLPTAKRLIDAHQGHIRIACPERGGTSVTIELPASATPATASA
jgi:signal transduction histidine kinase